MWAAGSTGPAWRIKLDLLMPRALICSGGDLSSELAKTVLWRAGVERLTAFSFDQARMGITSLDEVARVVK